MNSNLDGKNVLVTGGTSGIGLAISHALAEEGANIAIVGRHHDDSAQSALRKHGTQILSIEADISHESEIERVIQETFREFGTIDCFVNNAARALHQPLTQIDTASYRTIVDTNLSACLWVCRRISRHFIERRRGCILVVGSTSMYTPGPTETVYRMTKQGLKSLVESMAIELAPYGVRVNLLVPGHFPTKLTANIPNHIEEQLKRCIPLRRFGNTAECGSAAVFLLSDSLASYITGSELVVDGGLSLRPMYFGTDEELFELNHRTD